MRISMQIVADRLKQNYPDCRHGKMSSEINLKRPMFYERGVELKNHRVYLVRERDLEAQCLEQHGENLLLVLQDKGELPDELPYGVLTVSGDYEMETVFNAVQKIFNVFDAWDERIQNMAMSERTLQSLLDASHRIFHNPIIVGTTEGVVIDHSSTIYENPEFQSMLSRVQTSVLPYYIGKVEDGLCRFQDPDTRRNYLFVEIYDQNREAYRVVLAEVSRKLKRYDEYLLRNLAKYVQQMLERYTVVQSDMGYSLDRLLSNILTGEPMDVSSLGRRFESFDWKEEHFYFCMTIHVSTVDRQNLTVVRFICNRLENLLWGSCAFLLEENIVVFVNLNENGNTAENALKLVADFLKDSFLKAGISYPFRGLRSLKQYYLQSKIALTEGMKRYPLRWMNRFESIALEYLLEQCTETLGSDVICSRAVLALRAYDAEHKTDYYETLRTYITCQMNAVKAAKTLYIHRSTFLYRMAHIKELVNLDLDDPDQLLYLLLTYKLLEKED